MAATEKNTWWIWSMVNQIMQSHLCYMPWFHPKHQTMSRCCFSCSYWLPCVHNSSSSRYRCDPGAPGTFRSTLYAWEHRREWTSCTNPLGGFLLGQQSHQETPTAVKCNDVQELAVEIPLCTEGNFAEPHPEGEKKPHHEWVSYNASFLIHFCANCIRGYSLPWWK